MIEVRMQFESLDEMVRTLSAVSEGFAITQQEAPPAKEPEAEDDEKRRLLQEAHDLGVKVRANASIETIRKRIADAKAGAEKPANQATDPEDAPSTEVSEESAAPTLDDVRAALRGVNDKGGMPAVNAIVQRFGVDRISLLPEDQYEDFIKACKEAAA